MASGYKDAKDAAKDLQYGDVISTDDYNDIINFNDALSEFFDITATGEHKLKTSGEALNKALDEFEEDKLIEGLAAANEKIRELQGLSERQLHKDELFTTNDN